MAARAPSLRAGIDRHRGVRELQREREPVDRLETEPEIGREKEGWGNGRAGWVSAAVVVIGELATSSTIGRGRCCGHHDRYGRRDHRGSLSIRNVRGGGLASHGGRQAMETVIKIGSAIVMAMGRGRRGRRLSGARSLQPLFLPSFACRQSGVSVPNVVKNAPLISAEGDADCRKRQTGRERVWGSLDGRNAMKCACSRRKLKCFFGEAGPCSRQMGGAPLLYCSSFRPLACRPRCCGAAVLQHCQSAERANANP